MNPVGDHVIRAACSQTEACIDGEDAINHDQLDCQYNFNSSFGLKRPGDIRLSAKICSQCQQHVAVYRFITREGYAIVTYHCMEHGDVIPACARRDPPPLHS